MNRANFPIVVLLLSSVTLIALAGCGGPRAFIHPDIDLSYYETVGVLPFRNLTNDRLAGERVTNAFVTELLVKNIFDVVEPGQFRRISTQILGTNISSDGEWDPEKMKQLGSETGAQGIITGTVREYEVVRIGQSSYPLVTIDVKLIDVETTRIAWMISHTKKGGPNLPILSVGEIYTLGELTQEACREVVGKISD